MPTSADRAEFAPPPQPAALQALLLAVIAHLLLLLALTWGINWKRESDSVVAEAELWSSVPQQAAPKVVQAPPIVAAPQPVPAPPPAPAPPPPPPPPPPAPREVAPPPLPPKQPDIALEREKKQQELAERRREELEQQQKIEARREREELEREKKLEARKKEEQLKREQLAQQKAAEEKERKKKEEQAKAKAKQEETRLAALRQENLRRMQGLATATGAPDSPGTADRSSGPSASYAGRIRARVKPNIAFTDDLPGNPTAEVEVRMSPDGTITSRRLTKPSGVNSWDQAVLRALDRTQVLPRDVDGRVHTPLLIEFRYKG